MHDNKEIIVEIHNILEGLKGFFPEIAGLFSSALNGVSDSQDRALIGQTRLARNARLSVAASAASILGPVLQIGNLNETLSRKVVRLVQAIQDLTSDAEFVGEGVPDIPVPRGWKKINGAFVKKIEEGGFYAVTRREHLPGGEWTLFCSAVPVYVGNTVYDATQMADTIQRMKLRSKSKRHDLVPPKAPQKMPASFPKR
jgi:hypothetical protein